MVKKVVTKLNQKTKIAIDQIRERFGEGAIMHLGDAKSSNIGAISSGCLSLDIALGVGGVPKGRIIEIYGPESSGKTTLAQHIVAEAQKKGGVAAFVDAEHALDPDYAKIIGVNTKEISLLIVHIHISCSVGLLIGLFNNSAKLEINFF